MNKEKNSINENKSIDTFQLFQLNSLEIEEIREKLPSLLTENGDDLNKDLLLKTLFRILKDTYYTAKGNQYSMKRNRR